MSNGRKNGSAILLAGLVLCWELPGSTIAQVQGQSKAPAAPTKATTGADASPQNSMAAYREFMKYPPESRPLVGSNWDLLHPWTVDSSSLPMIPTRVAAQVESSRRAGMSDDEAWRSVTLPTTLPRYRFELSSDVLAGTRHELKATLSLTSDQAAVPPPQLHITRAELIGDADFGSSSLGTIPYSCQASGATCTFHWKAPAARKEYWGVINLVVTANLAGSSDEFVMRQSFYSSPMTAGKFTGQFQERLENGSLIVDAGVEVARRMVCFVSANLYSIDEGLPTHHAERRLIVDPSMHTIAFTFFGKIFRDFGHEGTFRLQDLKAQCENLHYPPEWFMDSVAHKAELLALQANPPAIKEPSRIYFEYNDYTYTTHRYSSSDFSDREWQSPESSRKVSLYDHAAGELTNPSMDALKQQLLQQLSSGKASQILRDGALLKGPPD
jgi:hypothetical protein